VKKTLSSKITLSIITVLVAFCWAAYVSDAYYERLTEERLEVAQSAQQEADELVGDIEQALAALPEAATALAESLANRDDWSSKQLEQALMQILLSQPRIFGVGVAFEPYQFDENMRLYSPYAMRREQGIEKVDVADFYDYTEQQYEWYGKALRGAPRWNELFYGQVSQAWLVEYVVPVIKDGQAIGLVYINYTLDALQKRINLTDLGEDGYSFIVDSNGRLVDYPVLEEVYSHRSLYDQPGFQNTKMRHVIKRALSRESGNTEYKSDITERNSWLFYAPVAGTNLSVLTVFAQPSMLTNDPWLHRQIFNVLIAWSVLLLSLMGVYLACCSGPGVHGYWAASMVSALILIVTIGALWYISFNAESEREENVTQVVSQADLADFKRQYTRESLINHGDPPLYVPTGVFIQSIEFSSANNVVLTGYIWQRYAARYHKGLSRNIVMPEAESFELTEAYRQQEQASELIGWYFRATLRQNFDYGHYPLDRQSVWIRLWHKDFDRNVVLVPDLGAYDQLNPDWLPGIEKDFVLSGWTLWRSYFNYHHNSYNTNFGIDNYVGQTRFPELYFNIGLKRAFFDPFVSQLAPIFVVLLMLFAVLLTCSRDEERITLLGFNTARVLAACSALFFVVLLSHIDLRSSLAGKEILYLENFYFVTYLTLLVVSVNSILLSWGMRFLSINGKSLIQHRDNLLPKLMFWPMVTGQLFLLTLLDLYPSV